MDYPLDITIKVEESDLERDSNDNYEQLLLDVSVKVEKQAQIKDEPDWCVPTLGSPGELLEPLFFKKLTELDAEKCVICNRYFSDRKSLLEHNLIHLQVLIRNPKLFQCDVCAAYFTDKRKIYHHMKAQHIAKLLHRNTGLTHMLSYKPKAFKPNNLPFVARYGKTYIPKPVKTKDRDIQLKDGVTNTLKYKPRASKGFSLKDHECVICGKVLPYKSWHSHMREVHGSWGYFCGICTMEFKCKRYFLRHMKKRHPSTEKSKTKGRVRKSVPKDPIPCDECDHISNGKYALTTHKRNVHSNSEHVCEICNSKLKCKAYLLAHMKRVHYDDGKMHQCECGKKFKSPRYLRVHKKNAHSRK